MSEHHFDNSNISNIHGENANKPVTEVQSMNISRENTDSVVYSIIEKFKRRADFGKKKYNTDLDRKDLSLRDWYNHLHEELFDSILYLEKIMQEIDNIRENDKKDDNSV